MTEPTPKRWTFRLAVALVAVAFAVAAGLFVWQFWWVARQAQSVARDTTDAYLAACGTSSTSITLPRGTVIGLLTLPGDAIVWPVMLGTSDADLRGGVGWYQETAAPGQVGNMVVVGQRLASGGAFDAILSIDVGDTVTLQTCTTAYTYTVVTAPRDLTVQPSDAWVMGAVPGQPSAMPSDAWLTLIANQDIVASSDRAVGFAKLTSTSAR